MQEEKLKLNLGAGACPIPGYSNLDLKTGTDVRNLPHEDGTVDEIRASHVLEHIPRSQTMSVLRHWYDKLKPGGVLKIAVPDMEWLIDHRYDGDPNWEGYLYGGQTDDDDYHKAGFNFQKMEELLVRFLGMEEFGRFDADWNDCSSHACSLNVTARKPVDTRKSLENVCIVSSMPRLGFTDNFLSIVTASRVLNMSFIKTSGAFWGQCLERAMEEQAADQKIEWILTVDYDSVFNASHVLDLYRTAVRNNCDAIFAMQSKRESPFVMLTVPNGDGTNKTELTAQDMALEAMPVKTGHFGLTLIRTAALRQLKHPWFWSQPAPDGSWNDGRTDEDIWFWRKWEEAGFKLHQANRVRVGHAQLVVTWPDRQWQAKHQYINDFYKEGQPTWAR